MASFNEYNKNFVKLFSPVTHFIKSLETLKDLDATQALQQFQKVLEVFIKNFKEKDFLTEKHLQYQLLSELNNTDNLIECMKKCMSLLNLTDLWYLCIYSQTVNDDPGTSEESVTSFQKETKKKIQNDIYLYGKSNGIVLCIMQLDFFLKLLLTTFLEEINRKLALQNLRNFIACQLLYLLDTYLIYSESSVEIVNEKMYDFMHFMDSSLELVSQINIDEGGDVALQKCHDAKNDIDELICQTMSVALIATDLDAKAIKAISYKVLREHGELLKELNAEKIDIAICKLLVDNLSNSLYALERLVNFAILNLLPEIFMDTRDQLRKLYLHCKTSKVDFDKRSIADIEFLIQPFDKLLDSVLQIGLFAVSCSTDLLRINEIHNCVASLEGLQKELIPALVGMYLQPSTTAELHVSILFNEWFEQLKTFENSVFYIVDPGAFLKIISDKYNKSIRSISYSWQKTEEVPPRDVFSPILKQTDTLYRFLKICLNLNNTQFSSSMKCSVQQLGNVIVECLTAVDKLFLKQTPNKDNFQRILKRFIILIKTFQKLHQSVAEVCEFSYENSCSELEDSFFDSIQEEYVETLKHIIEKSAKRQMTQPFLYKTNKKPTNSKPKFLLPFLKEDIIKFQESSLVSKTFIKTLNRSNIWNNTSLEITNFLEDPLVNETDKAISKSSVGSNSFLISDIEENIFNQTENYKKLIEELRCEI